MTDNTTSKTNSNIKDSLLDRRVKYNRSVSNVNDELHIFRSYLRWMCVDQSNLLTAALSWLVYIVFAVAVPAASHFLLACPSCDARHSRPFDAVVQLSLSVVATVSFLSLSRFIRKYGLRRFLFLDKLCDESETVRMNYMSQLNRSLKIVSWFVGPCFVAEAAYKIWWYASGSSQIPFLGNVYVSDAVACILELCSWLYRTGVIFLVCVLFRLICHLQILRLHDFATFFHVDSDVASVMSEHLRIRRHLRIISHRYRAFILLALLLVTGSQFACLLVTTKSKHDVNIFKAGELAIKPYCRVSFCYPTMLCLCSPTLVFHSPSPFRPHLHLLHLTGSAVLWFCFGLFSDQVMGPYFFMSLIAIRNCSFWFFDEFSAS